MFTLEITGSAESDLDQITDYMASTLANPQAALSFINEVDRVADTLATTPELFPLCSNTRPSELGYQKAIVRAYILVYEINMEEQVVRVLRFFHSSENYANKL